MDLSCLHVFPLVWKVRLLPAETRLYPEKDRVTALLTALSNACICVLQQSCRPFVSVKWEHVYGCLLRSQPLERAHITSFWASETHMHYKYAPLKGLWGTQYTHAVHKREQKQTPCKQWFHFSLLSLQMDV